VGIRAVISSWTSVTGDTALMRAIEAQFPAVSGFELFTGSRSEANIRLYVRLGYAVTGTRRVSERVTLVVLSKVAATAAG